MCRWLTRSTCVVVSMCVATALVACARFAQLEGLPDIDPGDGDGSGPLSAAEAGTTADGSEVDPPPADAGTHSFTADPGKVVCAEVACDAGQERCCIDSRATFTCRTPSTNCNGTEMNCDEQADCSAGSVCCLRRDPNYAAWSTFCQTTCPAPGAVVCKSDTECAPETKCVPITCGTVLLGSCGAEKPPECK